MSSRERAGDAAARRAVILGKTGDERFGARSVAVMDDEKPDAQIHQGKRDGVPGAARADQHDRRALRGGAPERFLEAVAPAAAVEIIAGGAAVRRNRHGIDRAGLRRLGVHGVEQRHDLLLERET